METRPSLWNMQINDSATIDELDLCLDVSVSTRLQETGFAIGEMIKCVKRLPINGPLIYEVGDGYFSLEREIAEKIYLKREQ